MNLIILYINPKFEILNSKQIKIFKFIKFKTFVWEHLDFGNLVLFSI